jgi:hypothetical protein
MMKDIKLIPIHNTCCLNCDHFRPSPNGAYTGVKLANMCGYHGVALPYGADLSQYICIECWDDWEYDPPTLPGE